MTHITEEEFQIIQQRLNPSPNHFSDEARPDPGPESNLLRKCTQWCRDHGYKYIHVQGKKNQAGILDLYIFMPNAQVVIFELKSKGKGMSPEQKAWVSYLSYHSYKVFPGVKSYKRFLEIVERVERIE